MKRLATATVAAVMAAAPVMADLVFPSLSYRTGAYAAGGIPFADGYADYMTLLNERDGGIGGVMTRILECETGYNTGHLCGYPFIFIGCIDYFIGVPSMVGSTPCIIATLMLAHGRACQCIQLSI